MLNRVLSPPRHPERVLPLRRLLAFFRHLLLFFLAFSLTSHISKIINTKNFSQVDRDGNGVLQWNNSEIREFARLFLRLALKREEVYSRLQDSFWFSLYRSTDVNVDCATSSLCLDSPLLRFVRLLFLLEGARTGPGCKRGLDDVLPVLAYRLAGEGLGYRNFCDRSHRRRNPSPSQEAGP